MIAGLLPHKIVPIKSCVARLASDIPRNTPKYPEIPRRVSASTRTPEHMQFNFRNSSFVIGRYAQLCAAIHSKHFLKGGCCSISSSSSSSSQTDISSPSVTARLLCLGFSRFPRSQGWLAPILKTAPHFYKFLSRRPAVFNRESFCSFRKQLYFCFYTNISRPFFHIPLYLYDSFRAV